MFNIFRRRLLINRIATIAIVLFIIYELGVVTHLFEKNLNDFHYSSEFDFKLAVERLEQNDDLVNSININNHTYKFLYDSSETCNNNHVFIVIMVKTKYSHFEQREAIRSTWGKTDLKGMRKTVFLIGKPEITDDLYEFNKKIQQEHDLFGDIVQQDFLDTYYNNTLKAIMGLQWIQMYCKTAQYYLFIDDDYFLNPSVLINYLKVNVAYADYETLYGGFVFPDSSPMRYLFHKWYVSLEEYPYAKYPPYVSAGCYLLSKTSAKKFYIASRLVPKFRFDDIYMGILSSKLKIRPFHMENVYFDPPGYSHELYSKNVLASHGFTPKNLKKIWLKINNVNNS
jgi:beta-1,3-galactosyltransferase / beta-1,3-N-acetylglucosaminyltransferase